MCWALDGKRREEWSHTASILAMIANANRDRKKRKNPFKPSDFDPMHNQTDKPMRKDPAEVMSALKSAFKKLPRKKASELGVKNG